MSDFESNSNVTFNGTEESSINLTSTSSETVQFLFDFNISFGIMHFATQETDTNFEEAGSSYYV